MKTSAGSVGIWTCVVLATAVASSEAGRRAPQDETALHRARVENALSRLRFEENAGQTDASVRFLSRGPGYALFLTPSEVVLSLRGPESTAPTPAEQRRGSNERERSVLRMEFVGAAEAPELAGVKALGGASHYYRGADPTGWHRDVPHYGSVVYRELWAGVDAVFYDTSRGELESDFTVAPHADPGVIRLRFEGAHSLRLDEAGSLVLEVATGEVVQHRPLVYQEVDGERAVVAGSWVLKDEGEVGFEVARYDRSQPLVIDPVLAYFVTLGGAGYEDSGVDIAVDEAGNTYVTGYTDSTDFPSAGTPSQSTHGGMVDAFVVKLGPTSNLVYSTYLGGSGWEFGHAVDVDAAGNAHVTGDTDSEDFPTAGTPSQAEYGGYGDAYVAKLGPTSSLVYSTYLGGSGFDWGRDLAVGAGGNAHVVGGTESEDFPTAGTPYQGTSAGGGDAFVTQLGPTSALLYSTYLGGSGYVDGGDGVAVDAGGDVYLTGITESEDFPTAGTPYQGALAGAVDAFVARLSLTTGLVYSSYLGGSGMDRGYGISVDGSGDAHVTGNTQSSDFPTAGAPAQPTHGGGQDAFVAKLSPGTGLVYSTFVGGEGYDGGQAVATDTAGNAFVVGSLGSTETGDAFVATFQWTPLAPTVNLKINGTDAVYPAFVTTAAPLRLAIDMTEGPNELDHYYYWWVGGTYYWFTSAGMSTTAAPLASFAPVSLTDYELFNGDLAPGPWVFGWLVLDGSSVVHSDFIVAVVTP